MRPNPLRPNLDLHTPQHPPLNVGPPNIPPQEQAMRARERERLDRLPDRVDRVRW